MEELAEIPMPQVLDPRRPLRPHGTEVLKDHRPETEVLGEALEQSCAYGQQLWTELDRVRAYLLDLLPPVPGERAQSPEEQPRDEARWLAWVDTFAAVTSVLCGPAGDGGFGRERAQREMRARRGG